MGCSTNRRNSTPNSAFSLEPSERFQAIAIDDAHARVKPLREVSDGKKIDQQVHLGYDLSVTQHVGVVVSNDGRVVYAAPLGIYGNCIVVDHGYGLQSIYGHLSEIAVHEGYMVKRGQIMGKSGQTGMAGGDHIHFSMQLEGVQIDPKELVGRPLDPRSHRETRGSGRRLIAVAMEQSRKFL